MKLKLDSKELKKGCGETKTKSNGRKKLYENISRIRKIHERIIILEGRKNERKQKSDQNKFIQYIHLNFTIVHGT